MDIFWTGARPDLLEEIKKLGFNPDPISFSPRELEWFIDTSGGKEWVQTSTIVTCLSDDHPKFPRLPLDELFYRGKDWLFRCGS